MGGRVQIHKTDAINFIEKMKREGLRARNVNITMPEFLEPTRHISRLINEARDIICPNGNIWIQSENSHMLGEIKEHAKQRGLGPHQIKLLHPNEIKTHFEKDFVNRGFKIYQLRITVPPARVRKG